MNKFKRMQRMLLVLIVLGFSFTIALILGWGMKETRAAKASVDTTLWVDRPDDSNGVGFCSDDIVFDCSLRDAITIVNSNLSFTFTIYLSPIFAPSILISSSGCGDNGNIVDDFDIFGKVDIEGDNATIAVDQNTFSRIFHVHENAVVSVRDITLADGDTCEGGGAALYNEGATTLDNVILADNEEISSGEVGGAIINETAASLTITNSILEHNQAQSGGAILNFGTLTLTRSILRENEATGMTNYGRGGAIYNSNGAVLVILGSDFLTNTTTNNDGGAIYNDGTLVVIDSDFVANEAVRGGALYNGLFNLPQVTIDKSTFKNNTATSLGGGIVVALGSVQVQRSQFEENHAVNGGAIYATANVTSVNILRSSFISNTVDANGGALFSDGDTTVKNSTFYSNSATSEGGAVYATGGTLDLYNITVSHSSGTTYGGIYETAASTFDMDNSIIANTLNGADCFGAPGVGNNLIEDGSCSATHQGDAWLRPLGDYGGPTLTMAPFFISPAVDGGDNSLCAAAGIWQDQRGLSRPYDANDDGINKCDIGAVEYRPNVKCNWNEGDTKTYGAAGITITVPIGGLGDIDCIIVDKSNEPAPGAPTVLQTTPHWHITAVNSNRESASDYNLTLSFSLKGAAGGDKACRQVDVGWDCGAEVDNIPGIDEVTRQNVKALSPWAVGHGVLPPSTPDNMSIAIAGAGNDFLWLDWMDKAVSTGLSTGVDYIVYRGTNPFDTFNLLDNTNLSEYIDTPPPQLVGNPAINYYYEVVAKNADDLLSTPSSRVGEFDFTIIPGS